MARLRCDKTGQQPGQHIVADGGAGADAQRLRLGAAIAGHQLDAGGTVRKLGAGYSVSFTREVDGKVLTFSGMSLSPRQFKLLVESVRNLVADLAQRQ